MFLLLLNYQNPRGGEVEKSYFKTQKKRFFKNNKKILLLKEAFLKSLVLLKWVYTNKHRNIASACSPHVDLMICIVIRGKKTQDGSPDIKSDAYSKVQKFNQTLPDKKLLSQYREDQYSHLWIKAGRKS